MALFHLSVTQTKRSAGQSASGTCWTDGKEYICPAHPYPETTAGISFGKGCFSMTAKTFSVVLGEINEKYLNEAISYKAKKKNGWLKWGAIAACLCLVVIGAFVAPNLIGEQSVEQPMGQGFFNATVVEIEGEIVVVECTDSLQSNVPVGGKVQISTDTISSEAVPELEIGDNVRVLYLGKITDGDLLVLENTISIFLLDEKGEPIVKPTE